MSRVKVTRHIVVQYELDRSAYQGMTDDEIIEFEKESGEVVSDEFADKVKTEEVEVVFRDAE